MLKQNAFSYSELYKIEILGPEEELERISTFLDNNFIKHNVVDANSKETIPEEIDGYFDWPLE